MAEEGYKVQLHVYDLSQGLARQLSSSFLGKVIDGIWHTGVVVYGNEYFFSGGIQTSPAGRTHFGRSYKVVELGTTQIPQEVFEDYINEIAPRYTQQTYSLLEHNCNNFSEEVSQFLLGVGIPEYILKLPLEIKNSPLGGLIMPMIQQFETTLRYGGVPQAPLAMGAPQVSLPMGGFGAPPVSLPIGGLSQLPPMRTQGSKSQSTSNATSTVSTNVSGGASNQVRSTSSPAENGGTNLSTSEVSASKMVNGESKSLKVPAENGGNATTDKLGDARALIQKEITSEFAALMAEGSLHASEAAALATRRVMERHGRVVGLASQS